MNIKQLAENLELEEKEYIELLELFVHTGLSGLNELESAFTKADAGKVSETAHSIKGAAGNLGLMELHEMFRKIEEDARAGVLEGVVASTRVLKKKLAEIETLIQGF